MNDFSAILTSIGLGPQVSNVDSGGIPELTYKYNAGGLGFQSSLVIELKANTAVHVTIYKSTWDGRGRDVNYGEAPLGPRSMHLSYLNKHIFYKVEDAGDGYFPWRLTDQNDNSSREDRVAKTFLSQLSAHL